MKRAAFDYDLPDELIAQAPLPQRSASRLLVLDGPSGAVEDRWFRELPSLLEPGDLVVFNDTRVLPARLRGSKSSGGRVELLLERITGPRTGRFQLRASHAPKPGSEICLPAAARARVVAREDNLFDVELDCDLLEYLESHGEIPLPPYIERPADAGDAARYQTVFAAEPGAVAAPTAGLHFDAETLSALARRGVETAYLTLHVGAGTFAPVRAERIEDHELHPEWLRVSRELCEQIRSARARGGRIVAVGTTSVRSLEAAAERGTIEPFEGETRLFIRPGFDFRVVDAIVTNFHLPESSLIMLVAAFAGYEATMRAYRHAVNARYRFFSYGDAMFISAGAVARGEHAHAV